MVNINTNQRAVLKVFRICDREMLDEELIVNYKRYRSQFKLPRQSESGIRTRRAELARAGYIFECSKMRMSTGRTGRLWKIEDGS